MRVTRKDEKGNKDGKQPKELCLTRGDRTNGTGLFLSRSCPAGSAGESRLATITISMGCSWVFRGN
jgi:hypothetical protein